MKKECVQYPYKDATQRKGRRNKGSIKHIDKKNISTEQLKIIIKHSSMNLNNRMNESLP